MSAADARMWEIVEAAAREVTDDATGRFESKELIGEIRARLASKDLEPHVRVVTLDRLAKSLADSFVKSRNPRPRLGKPKTLFNAGAILPLGDGKRIWMEYAGPNDLIEWARLSTKNLARVATAEGSRQAYVADRLEAFLSHAEWLLGKIEREVFGYVDEPAPVVEDEDDELDAWDEDE